MKNVKKLFEYFRILNGFLRIDGLMCFVCLSKAIIKQGISTTWLFTDFVNRKAVFNAFKDHDKSNGCAAIKA
jgi:hypothetical protein